MVKLFISVFFLIIAKAVNSQNHPATYYQPTSVVVNSLSKIWKQDSIGKNGYRTRLFDDLRFSKVDKLTKETVFERMGRPNQVSRFYSGNTRKNYVGYIYYTACVNDYPKDKWYWGGYIEFVFDETESLLLYIDDGDFCG